MFARLLTVFVRHCSLEGCFGQVGEPHVPNRFLYHASPDREAMPLNPLLTRLFFVDFLHSPQLQDCIVNHHFETLFLYGEVNTTHGKTPS